MFQRLLVVLTPSCVYHYQAVSLGIVLADHFHEMISQPSSPSIYPSQEELRVLHLHLFSMAPASSFPLPESPVVSLHTQAVTWYLQFAFFSDLEQMQTDSCQLGLVMVQVLPQLHHPLQPIVSSAPFRTLLVWACCLSRLFSTPLLSQGSVLNFWPHVS